MVLYSSMFRRRCSLALMMVTFFLLFVVPLTVSAHGAMGEGGLQLETPKGEKCIRPEGWMRRNHMDFLKHRRDMTVRDGIRVRSESLKRCAGCHTSREKFCDRCHAYVAVAPNCFDCHSYPK